MTFILIAKVQGFHNKACDRTYEGYLVAEFILLIFFALTDTLYFRFMNGIYLFLTITPWEKNGFKNFE